MGSELELPGQPNRDSMEPAPRVGTERPSLMMAREPAVAYHPVASEWHPPRTLWEWVGENAEYVADAGVVLVCLIVYASLEGGHPRSTFLISSLMYQYSYPLKVRPLKETLLRLKNFETIVAASTAMLVMSGNVTPVPLSSPVRPPPCEDSNGPVLGRAPPGLPRADGLLLIRHLAQRPAPVGADPPDRLPRHRVAPHGGRHQRPQAGPLAPASQLRRRMLVIGHTHITRRELIWGLSSGEQCDGLWS